MKFFIKSRWGIVAVLLAMIFGLSNGLAQNLTTDETLALLNRLAQSRSAGTVQADFHEKKFLPMLREPVVESGKIAFEQPDKLLRKLENGSLIISNGKTLWMYYPQFQQAEKYPISSARGPGEFFSALAKVFQLQKLDDYFRVEASRIPNGFHLELSPRNGMLRKILRHISIELGEDLRLRSSVITGSEGDRIETSYSNEKVFPAGSIDFSFTPPKNTNVVSPFGG